MSTQNLITPKVYTDVPLENTDVEVPGSIHADTSAFLVVLVVGMVAVIAALI